MANNTVTLHRVLKATPEKVYRVFTEPNALASWLPPYGFICVVHKMDVKVGGDFKMSFTNFSTGNGHSFGGKYLELKPADFLKYTDKFDSPHLPGEMVTSVWFKKVSCGTELTVIQEGIPAAIPTEMCYLGWQESLQYFGFPPVLSEAMTGGSIFYLVENRNSPSDRPERSEHATGLSERSERDQWWSVAVDKLAKLVEPEIPDG